MIRSCLIVCSFYIIIFLFSCSSSDDNSLLFTVNEGTFVNEIEVQSTIEAVRSITVTCPARIEGTVLFLVEDGTYVEKGDTVCILENRQLENEYEDLLRRVEVSQAQYNRGKADMEMNYAMLQAQVENNKAQLSITQLDTAQLEYLPDYQRRIRELEIQRATVEKTKLERKLEFLELINETELHRLQLQIEQQKSQAENVKARLAELTMTAPQNGLALRANHRRGNEKINEGDQVWQNMPLVEIPDMTEVKAMMMVSENAYKRISVGDSIIFTFDAMPGNMAWGNIQRKAPVGRPVSRDSRVREFEITATVDTFHIIPEVGISGNTRIILKSIPNSLAIPRIAVFDTDTLRVVYIKQGANYVEQEVFTGETSPREAMILAGIEPFDRVSLRKPEKIRITQTRLLPDTLKERLSKIFVEELDTIEFEDVDMPFNVNGTNNDYDFEYQIITE